MTWQYSHMSSLPKEVESSVLCRWTANTEQFPVSQLTSLGMPPGPASLLGRFQRKVGIQSAAERRVSAFLKKHMVNNSPDVLHSHFGQCGWQAAKLAKDLGIPHVVSFYGLDLSYLIRQDPRWVGRYRHMSTMLDQVLCEGPHMADCLAALGVDRSKIRLFRLGVDLDKIPFKARKLEPPRKRFLVAGSFREKKGIPYALEALGLFSQKCPEIEITVIGDSGGNLREEREKKKILKIVERYGLSSKVRFLGYQPYSALIREFYCHDIFVSPSVTSSDGDTEGGAPVTIIEAAASGMPIASTLHCDIPFVLSEENRKYLVPERDSHALCKSIERLYSDGNWQEITSANRRLVERELNVKLQGRRLADHYFEVALSS